jgi:hypothetical protein
MSDLQLDDNGDILVTNDALTLVDGDAAIRQHLTIRLRFFLGEWFLDSRLGVPYFGSVLVKNPNLVLVRGIMRQAILSTPGVASLERFDFTYTNATRKMELDFTVRRTSDGGLLDYSKEFIVS